jgi:ABC-type Fe3+-hydroxamate transport system substrate-binding protein
VKPTFTDNFGTVHQAATPSARIISLVPSLTELLFDLGLGDQIVGRTRYCVHPVKSIESVPVIGGTKAIDHDAIGALKATHAIVNVDETPKPVADELLALGLSVIVTHPGSALDNPDLFRLFGGIFGKPDQAEQLCSRFDRALQDLTQQTQDHPTRRILYLVWQKPWMSVSEDTYISQTLRLVNWQTVAHDPEIRYPEIAMNTVLSEGVDLVLFSSEPFPFTEDHRQAFHHQFSIYRGQSAIIDAEMVSWYGSRAIDGLHYLARFAKDLNR